MLSQLLLFHRAVLYKEGRSFGSQLRKLRKAPGALGTPSPRPSLDIFTKKKGPNLFSELEDELSTTQIPQHQCVNGMDRGPSSHS